MSLQPVFITGSVKFEIDGHTLQFSGRKISLYGVSGLRWKPLIPEKHFGREVMVLVQIAAREQVAFRTAATLTREESTNARFMGLKFDLGPAQTIKLRKTIADFGQPPTDYMRRHPRIPSEDWIHSFPVRAHATRIRGPNFQLPFSLVLDVLNLSPSGMLLETQNRRAQETQPGHKMTVTIEPRGEFTETVTTQVQVFRTADACDPKSRNITRQLGVNFMSMERYHRVRYNEWIKDILAQIQKPKGR
jgi:hypothetical protein